MAETCFFSVVIPTYNRAAFIAATLESVFAQTFQSFEILVVDDGSTDATQQVVAGFSDERLHYYPKANEERGIARNYGFKRAKGRYVIFLDSDDCLLANHLTTLHAKILEQKFPNFIATKFNFDRNGYTTPSDLQPLAEGPYGLDFFVRGNALACNICVRRENPALLLFEENRSFAAVEDWMFMLENTQADTVYLIDAVTLVMNDHDFRSMRSNNSVLIQRWLRMADWVERRLRLTPAQHRQLQAHIYYLCAVHAYADGHQWQAARYLPRIVPVLPVRRTLPLLARIIAGPKLVERLKSLR